MQDERRSIQEAEAMSMCWLETISRLGMILPSYGRNAPGKSGGERRLSRPLAMPLCASTMLYGGAIPFLNGSNFPCRNYLCTNQLNVRSSLSTNKRDSLSQRDIRPRNCFAVTAWR